MLSLVGLTYLGDLDDAEHRYADQYNLKVLAQDALEGAKRQMRAEREEFRRAMNIRGIAMQQFYRVYAEKADFHPKCAVDVARFRIMLRPMDYFVEFATIEDPKIYKIPAVSRMFAEETAHKFAEHILKEMPAEIVKQLEAQL